MADLKIAKIGLYLAVGDPYAPYYREVLDHAGVLYEPMDKGSFERLRDFSVVLLCGRGTLGDSEREKLLSWSQRNGCLVCSGGTWDLESVLGIKRSEGPASPSNDTLAPIDNSHPTWPEGVPYARFFGGVYCREAGCNAISKTSGGFLGASIRLWQGGGAYFLAAHLGQTMSLMQQGKSVECDAVGPNDGSAVFENGELRAEDGAVLDFQDDREQPAGCSSPFFAYPHADIIKEFWLRLVFQAVQQTGKQAIVLWHWPNNAQGAATLSVDCEEFNSENVTSIHKVLMMVGAPAAWLVGPPGYSLDVYRAIRKWDHEVGLLFQTDNHLGWQEEKMKIQHVAISRSASMPRMVSARPASGRWKSLTAFYEIAEGAGARLSLGKGGRQPGTSGFLFGTCHPYFPQRRDGTSFHIAELPYTIFCPGLITPDAAMEPILQRTSARYGCLHASIKSDSAQAPAGAASLRRLITLTKQAKLVYMLPSEIYKFEKTRRSLRMRQWDNDGDVGINLIAEFDLPGLTVMLSGGGHEFQIAGRKANVSRVERYGLVFTAATCDLEAKGQTDILFRGPDVQSQAA